MCVTKEDLRLLSKKDILAFIEIQETINRSRTDGISENDSVLKMAEEVYKEM